MGTVPASGTISLNATINAAWGYPATATLKGYLSAPWQDWATLATGNFPASSISMKMFYEREPPTNPTPPPK